MKPRYYILIAVISYLFFTLTNVPAAKVLTLLKSYVELPAQINGIEGSLWNGSAQAVVIKNQPTLKNISWSINPVSLLLAQVSANVQAHVEGQAVNGHVNASLLSGSVDISDLRAELTAKELQQLMNLPFGELQGKISLEIQQLSIEGQNIARINGVARWNKAKFTLAETVSLGNIQIKLDSDEDKNILAEISNKGGQIKLQGEARLQPNKNYQLDMKFIPSKNSTPNIKQSLAMFAKRQTNGSYRLKQNGNLRQLGF